MKQSRLFTKTRKEAPADEVSKNASLLIRGGFIHKEMAGVYSFLPLGLRVLNNIVGVIREEVDAIGGEEVHLSALQDKAVWEKSGRWSDDAVDTWFKTSLKSGGELGLGFTHEEPLTVIMKDSIQSFRDLPVYAYQFQTKFRNETRAKSGIMRGREFLMKDLYSFSRDEKEHEIFYEKVKQAYSKIYHRLGIGEQTYVTFASGGSFARYSHEFQTLTEAGEDTIYVHEGKAGGVGRIAINKEVLNDEVLQDLGLTREALTEKKAVEVGNIFSLGTRFSDALGLTYLDEKGEKKPVIMGSYGIGPSRAMGTIVEVLSDEDGIVWPESVAPFQVHMLALHDKAGIIKKSADDLYATLTEKNIEVLYDDRDVRPGEKFADSDLIGIPLRVIVSEKNLAEGVFEIKYRKDGKNGKVKKVSSAELLKILEE